MSKLIFGEPKKTKMKQLTLFVFIFFFFSELSFSQEIKLDMISVDSISIDSIVVDSNLIKLRNDTILIGLKMSPPFTMKDENGNFTGVSVRLWETIAKDLNIKYRFKEYDLKNLLLAIEKGDVDLCISPLTVTSDRLKLFDFTQPFYTSNMSIAVKGQKKSFFILLLSNIFTLNFAKAILVLIGIIFLLGILLWLAERKNNPAIATNYKGIGDGIWWAAVTMTTVGYGDKTPISPLGRFIALFWMFLSIIIISSLTASITTALTMERINTNIEELQDLTKVKAATVSGSSTEVFFLKKGIKTIGLENIEDGLIELEKGEIDAFVYDEPILRYLIQKNGLDEKILIIDHEFNSQYYSFSLPHNHKLRDYINPLLIKELEGVPWKAILNEYNLSQE